MFRILVILIILIKVLFAQTQTQKTSELELFLFKVGFEALLKDVDSTKQRSQLNEDDIKNLKNKIKLIMDEVYKDKTNLEKSTTNNQELINLKKEIELLKKEIISLKSQKVVRYKKETKETNPNYRLFTVGNRDIVIYKRAITSSKTLRKLKSQTKLKIESCNSFGWCKLYGEDGYVRKFLLR